MVLFASIECFIELEGVLMQANIPSEQEEYEFQKKLKKKSKKSKKIKNN